MSKGKNILVTYDNKELVPHTCKLVKDKFNERYNIKSQIWLETRKDAIATVTGLIVFEKQIYYNTKMFNQFIQEVKDMLPSSQLLINYPTKNQISECLDTTVATIKNIMTWKNQIMNDTNICDIQQDSMNLFINVNNYINTKKDDDKINVLEMIHNGEIKDIYEIRGSVSESRFLNNKKKWIEEINVYEEKMYKKNITKVEWKPPTITDKYGLEWAKVALLCNKVIRKDCSEKKIHMWISGVPGLGKTRGFLSVLMEMLNYYEIDKDKIQNEPYMNGYDIIICDEYEGHKTIPWLNRLCDDPKGKGMKIRNPGGGNTLKKDRPVVILVSNCTIDEIYSKSSEIHRDALKSRFNEIELDQFGNIWEKPDEYFDFNKDVLVSDMIYNIEDYLDDRMYVDNIENKQDYLDDKMDVDMENKQDIDTKRKASAIKGSKVRGIRSTGYKGKLISMFCPSKNMFILSKKI